MKINIIYIIGVFIIFISCIEEAKHNEEYTNHQMVVNSFITAGENVVVSLYQNKPINSQYDPLLKKMANVVLYENDIEMETLTPFIIYNYNYDTGSQIEKTDSTYKYISQKTEIKAGNSYKIVIDCEGYETVTAETTIPFPVLVTAFDSLTENKERNSHQYAEYNYRLSFTDPVKQSNYYRVVVVESEARKSAFVFETDTLNFIDISLFPRNVDVSSTDPILSNKNKDANSYVFGELENKYKIFSDEMIDGKHYDLNIVADFTSSFFHDKEEIDYEAGEFSMVKVILQSLSADMYYYLRSIEAQEYSDNMIFTEPVPIYSNVDNGFGVFGGYSNSEIEIIYGQYPKEGVRYLTWKDISNLFEQ